MRKFIIGGVLLVFFMLGCKKNKAPEPPTAPWSISKTSSEVDSGWVDSTYWFITSAEDPEDDDICFMFNWGDGTSSSWIGEVSSEATVETYHVYTQAASYWVKAKARDIHKNESGWSDSHLVVISSKAPPPDSVKIVSVPDSVIVAKPQTFQIQGWDPNSDSIWYQCRFIGIQMDTAGDTTIFVDSCEWSILGGANGMYASGAVGEIQFTFQDTGTYVVIPGAKNKSGSLSEWGTSRTGKIMPPRVPYAPVINLLDQYPKYLPQTPYTFYAQINPLDVSLLQRGERITFDFSWGDSIVSSFTDTLIEVYHSHAYETHVISENVTCTLKVEDRWGQISPSSILLPSITITNNFIKEWKIDLLDTTAYAYGVATWGDSVYVVDNYNHEVKIFSKDGDLVGTIGTYNLESPMYIAVDSEFVYVTDAYFNWQKANKVYKFKKDGSDSAFWGGYGRNRGEFDFPTGIAVDSAYVYVMDHNNERIQKFTKDGAYVTDWYCPKSRGMTYDGGSLYVASYTENSILVFNTDGIQGSSIGANGSNDGNLLSPQDVSIYNNTVYVVEAGNARVQKLDKSGNFVTRWGCEGNKAGQIKNAYGITIDNEGNIYVIDTGNRRVQKFNGSVL